MFKSIHIKSIIGKAVTGLTNQAGNIFSSPGSDDCTPSPQISYIKTPVEHFFNIIMRTQRSIHSGSRVNSIWELYFIRRVLIPVTKELKAPFSPYTVFFLAVFCISIIEYPCNSTRSFGLFNTRCKRSHSRQTESPVIHVRHLPWGIIATHDFYSLQPAVCYGNELIVEIARMRIELIQLTEKDIRHGFIPPVVARGCIGAVQIDIFCRTPVEIFFA